MFVNAFMNIDKMDFKRYYYREITCSNIFEHVVGKGVNDKEDIYAKNFSWKNGSNGKTFN